MELSDNAPPRLVESPQPLDPEALLAPAYQCQTWTTAQPDRLPELPPSIGQSLVRLETISAAPLLDDRLGWPDTLQDTEASTTPIYVRPPVFVAPISPIASN